MPQNTFAHRQSIQSALIRYLGETFPSVEHAPEQVAGLLLCVRGREPHLRLGVTDRLLVLGLEPQESADVMWAGNVCPNVEKEETE